MKIGFTGTSKGCSQTQKEMLDILVKSCFASGEHCEFHHGDCIGADAEAHDMFYKCTTVHVHPPDNPKKRAFKQGHVMHPEKPYLERNHDIVDACEILFATPKGYKEEQRSGTWATVRYAKKCAKEVCIIFPNGQIQQFKEGK